MVSNRSPAVRPTQLRRKRPPENSAVSWQLAQAARKVASPRPACAAVNTPSSTESAGGGSFAGSVCAARIDAGAARPRMTVAARVIAKAPGRAESLRGRVSWEAAVRFVWSSRSNALPPDWRTFASRALACDDTAPAAGVARKYLAGLRRLCDRLRQQPLRRVQQPVFPGHLIEPAFGNAAQAVQRPGELSRHRRHRIGVIGQIGGEQHGAAEIRGAGDRPDGRFESVYTTYPLDLTVCRARPASSCAASLRPRSRRGRPVSITTTRSRSE